MTELTKEELVVELKRYAGWDLGKENVKLTYEIWEKQYREIKDNLNLGYHGKLESVFEVGCGSGASLIFFEKDGIRCGGIDYSSTLLDVAGRVLETKDLECLEACQLPTEVKYDAVLSNSVFSYFDDIQYAEQVLDQMLKKSNYSMGILDIHNKEKEDAFYEYRMSLEADYKERYKNLPKLFYEKSFFEAFAEKNDLRIQFLPSTLEGYWNNEYIFHCYMYRQ